MGSLGKAIGFVLVVLAFGIPSSLADAAPGQHGRFMVTGSITSQPIGHYDFCKRYREECLPHEADIRPPAFSKARWQLVRDINRTVNFSIMPETDLQQYGKVEYWTYPKTAGDCEDYALLKQYMLEQHGFKPSDLLITVVRKPDGEGHAVLTVRTARGDFILDNLVDHVKLWSDTPYTYLKRQAIDNSGRWVTIDNGSELLVGAVR